MDATGHLGARGQPVQHTWHRRDRDAGPVRDRDDGRTATPPSPC